MPLGHGPANGRNRAHRRHRSGLRLESWVTGRYDPAPGRRSVVIAGEGRLVDGEYRIGSRSAWLALGLVRSRCELKSPWKPALGLIEAG